MMAIYHCSAGMIRRSRGRSATAAAAYRAGEKITDERTGLVHDYRKKGGVDHTAILAPEQAPVELCDRATLWNAVERIEKRKDAQLAREIDVALPRELSPPQMQALVTGYARSQFVDKGMIADIAIHHASGDNPHAHILLTTRELTADGFGKKNRDWNRKELLQTWREAWEQQTNRSLEKAQQKTRIDHRSLEAQGIARVAQIHLGAKVIEMEKRGVHTERGNRAVAIEQTNAQIIDLSRQLQDQPTPSKPAPAVPPAPVVEPSRPPDPRGPKSLEDLQRERRQLCNTLERAKKFNVEVEVSNRSGLWRAQSEFDTTARHHTRAKEDRQDWERQHPVAHYLDQFLAHGEYQALKAAEARTQERYQEAQRRVERTEALAEQLRPTVEREYQALQQAAGVAEQRLPELDQQMSERQAVLQQQRQRERTPSRGPEPRPKSRDFDMGL